MRHNNTQGYAFLAMLVFLQLYTLLGLLSLQSAFYAARQLNLEEARFKQSEEAESVLQELEKQLGNRLPACQVPFTTAQQLKNHDLAWWQAYACTQHSVNYQYHYLVEKLAQNPCARLANQPQAGVDFYRLSLLLYSAQNPQLKTLLQSTYASPNPALKDCANQPHTVPFGRQSWQQL